MSLSKEGEEGIPRVGHRASPSTLMIGAVIYWVSRPRITGCCVFTKARICARSTFFSIDLKISLGSVLSLYNNKLHRKRHYYLLEKGNLSWFTLPLVISILPCPIHPSKLLQWVRKLATPLNSCFCSTSSSRNSYFINSLFIWSLKSIPFIPVNSWPSDSS